MPLIIMHYPCHSNKINKDFFFKWFLINIHRFDKLDRIDINTYQMLSVLSTCKIKRFNGENGITTHAYVNVCLNGSLQKCKKYVSCSSNSLILFQDNLLLLIN